MQIDSRITRDPGATSQSGVEEVDWEVLQSRSGPPTLVLGGRHVHSGYDPVREAEGVARAIASETRERSSDLIVMIGFGLGYIPNAIRRFTEVPLLVWEPFERIHQRLSAAAQLDPEAECPAQGCFRVVHNSADFDHALEVMSSDEFSPHFHIHPGYQHVARFEARYAVRAFRWHMNPEAHQSIDSSIVSLRDFEMLRRMTYRPTLLDLEGSLTGKTAIIASAGPSLTAGLPALARHTGGVVFASPQSLSPLYRAGVHVHYVVAPDPKDIFHIAGVPDTARYDTLLADTFSHPSLIDSRIDHLTHFHLRTRHMHGIAWSRVGLPCVDEPFLTVSETALWLAHYMGARRFVMLGVDLDSNDTRYTERFRTRNLREEIVETNSHYFHAARYLDYFCGTSNDRGAEIFRLSSGLPIRGCQLIDETKLDGILRSLPRYETPPSKSRLDRQRLKGIQDFARDLQEERRRRIEAGSEFEAEGIFQGKGCPPLGRQDWGDEANRLERWLEVRLDRLKSTRKNRRPGPRLELFNESR